MRKIQTGRNFAVMGVICLGLMFSSSDAFSWGFATHAYMDDHLGKNGARSNLNEIYGGVMPDLALFVLENEEGSIKGEGDENKTDRSL